MSVSVESASQIYQDSVRTSVRKGSLRYLVQGGLLVLAGVLAIVFPVISSEALILAIGWLLVISGIVQAVGLISARSAPFAGLQAVSVALSLIIGFLILRYPAVSLVTLSLLVVVFFMIEGVSKIVWALTIRPLAGWQYVLGSGILGVVLSIILILSIDTAASWLLALLVGVQLIAVGASVARLAWLTRQAVKH
jgi:uncharacterized membrane protein HdeD (DUF308 family)